jgi:hypothetical protein
MTGNIASSIHQLFVGLIARPLGAWHCLAVPYEMIKRAIQQRRSLTALLDDHIRHFSPHVLGRNMDALPVSLGFQYGGTRRVTPLPADGDWLLFSVSDLRDLSFNSDPWHPGPPGLRRPDWIAKIEVKSQDS